MLTGSLLLLLVFGVIAFIIVACTVWKWHPFLALLTSALITGILSGMSVSDITKYATEGFGNMMMHIGLVVVLGTLIGKLLEKTGATLTIARSILAMFGNKRPIAAITTIGAVVGIPIFCDSGYVILSGIAKPLAHQSQKPYAGIVGGLSSGLYITHTLLPPHPGALAGAANLGLTSHLGLVIALGLLISLPVVMIAIWMATKVTSNIKLDTDFSEESQPTDQLPPLLKSVMPIIVPIVLIAVGTLPSIYSFDKQIEGYFSFIGNPIIALLIGLLLTLNIVQGIKKNELSTWIKEGINHAGPILIIVGAGGCFGNVLKKTPIADMVKSWVTSDTEMSGFGLLGTAYLLGVLLKTAQGSTTSAIVVVSSILAPFISFTGIDTPVKQSLMLMAIASGSMAISHANDAYFWVIGQYSGLGVKDTFNIFSKATVLMSIISFSIVLLIYYI